MKPALFALLALLAGCASPATTPKQSSQATTPAHRSLPAPTVCAEDAGWRDPTTPRHVFGNTWFVGTRSIGAFLTTSPDGHVLIDAATVEAAPHVIANIRSAGFKVEDIKTTLVSHEHHDHVGGISKRLGDERAG